MDEADGWVTLSDQQYPYRFTHSRRAKYLRLKLSIQGELTVVVPSGVSLKHAQDFVCAQAAWIEQQLPKVTKLAKVKVTKPDSLSLQFIDENWVLHYQADESTNRIELCEIRSPSMSVPQGELLCSGLVDDTELRNKVIGEWLKAKAKQVIPQRLAQLAEQHGFHYRRVSIRGQKTRWGSCSSQKNINLNYKLLFLPEPLVNYVLIHELCHTLELNHSARFWQLVADCDANYQQHDQLLNRYAREIPL